GVVRPAPTVQNLLNYANFLALLGFFALCMLGWQLTRFKRVEAFLKMVAVALVVYALWLAESRGPWLSLVALMAFFFLFGLRAVAFPWRVATFVIALAVLVITLMQSERLAGRLYQSAEAVHQSVPALLEGQQPKGGDASTRI